MSASGITSNFFSNSTVQTEFTYFKTSGKFAPGKKCRLGLSVKNSLTHICSWAFFP
jgi:hypothetical protein